MQKKYNLVATSVVISFLWFVGCSDESENKNVFTEKGNNSPYALDSKGVDSGSHKPKNLESSVEGKEVEKIEFEIKKLKASIETKKREIQIVDSLIQTNSDMEEERRKEMTIFENEKEELESSMNNKKLENSDLEKKIKEIKDDISKIENDSIIEIENLKNTIKEKNEELAQLAAAKKKIKEEKSKKEKEEESNELKNLEKELETKGSECKNNNTVLERLEKEIFNLNQQNKNLENKLEYLNTVAEENAKKHDLEIKKIKEEIEKEKKELEPVGGGSDLKEKMNEIKEKISSLWREKFDINSRYSEYEDSINLYIKKFKSFNESNKMISLTGKIENISNLPKSTNNTYENFTSKNNPDLDKLIKEYEDFDEKMEYISHSWEDLESLIKNGAISKFPDLQDNESWDLRTKSIKRDMKNLKKLDDMNKEFESYLKEKGIPDSVSAFEKFYKEKIAKFKEINSLYVEFCETVASFNKLFLSYSSKANNKEKYDLTRFFIKKHLSPFQTIYNAVDNYQDKTKRALNTAIDTFNSLMTIIPSEVVDNIKFYKGEISKLESQLKNLVTKYYVSKDFDFKAPEVAVIDAIESFTRRKLQVVDIVSILDEVQISMGPEWKLSGVKPLYNFSYEKEKKNSINILENILLGKKNVLSIFCINNNYIFVFSPWEMIEIKSSIFGSYDETKYDDKTIIGNIEGDVYHMKTSQKGCPYRIDPTVNAFIVGNSDLKVYLNTVAIAGKPHQSNLGIGSGFFDTEGIKDTDVFNGFNRCKYLILSDAWFFSLEGSSYEKENGMKLN